MFQQDKNDLVVKVVTTVIEETTASPAFNQKVCNQKYNFTFQCFKGTNVSCITSFNIEQKSFQSLS